MSKRGPRGDINQDVILAAALALLGSEGSIAKVSLRMVAREVGVAPNALYTYFPSMDAVWDEARERQLTVLLDRFLPKTDCSRCGLAELLLNISKTDYDPFIQLFQRWTQSGPASVRFAEEILRLTDNANMPSHNARDFVFMWMVGRISLFRDGALQPERREGFRLDAEGDFPREAAANAEPWDPIENVKVELRALLNGLELKCTCGADPQHAA